MLLLFEILHMVSCTVSIWVGCLGLDVRGATTNAANCLNDQAFALEEGGTI